MSQDKEMVNHPDHYNASKVETIDAIESIIAPLLHLPSQSYNIGTAVKYLARYMLKHESMDGKIEDLKKAIWCINRAISNLEEEAAKANDTGQDSQTPQND